MKPHRAYRGSLASRAVFVLALSAAAVVAAARPARAIGADRADVEVVDPATGGGRPESTASSLTADESRVVDWAVEHLLELAGSDAPVIDITAENVAAATGVDVATLDAGKVRDEVTRRLLEIVGGHPELFDPAAKEPTAPESTECAPRD